MHQIALSQFEGKSNQTVFLMGFDRDRLRFIFVLYIFRIIFLFCIIIVIKFLF